EEVLGVIYMRYDARAPEGQRGAILGTATKVRAVKAFDWKAKLQKLVKDVKEVSYEGQTYYKTPQPRVFFFQGKGLCFFIPDDRTIVAAPEENLRGLIRRGPEARPAYLWAEGWQQVAHADFAFAIDNRQAELKMDVSKDTPASSWELNLFVF